MRVLIDTNILIDYISKNPLFFENSREIIRLCSEKRIDGCIAAHSITNAFYILRKELTVEERKSALLDICLIISVIGIDKAKIISSLKNNSFDDLEDCLQSECAAAFSGDYIITRDSQGFINSGVPAISPEDFLKELKAE